MDGKNSNSLVTGRRTWPPVHAAILHLFVFAFCLLLPQSSFGQGSDHPPGFPFPPADSPLGWEGGLFGDCQARKNLADRGITFFGVNQMFTPATVAGGKRTAMDPTNRFVGSLNLDFEKMGCCKGSQFRISFARNDGQNLADEVGTPYNPSTLFQPAATRLWQLYFGQWFWDKQAHVKIGRISANNEDFNWTPFGFPFASAGYDAGPGPMYINNPGFGAEPIAQWGARLRIEPHDADYVFRFGVYNSSETFLDLADPNENGLNFRFAPDEGTLYAAEYWYKRNYDPEDTGLPGNYRVGALYDTATFDRLDVPGTTKRGNFNFYLSLDQMVYREGCGCQGCPDNDQGLWGFVAFVTNPDQAVAGDGPQNYPYFASWGLHYKGLFRGRDNDWTSFGNYYNVSSRFIPGDLEVQFNFAHVFAVKPWMVITPEIMYYVDPGGTGTIPDALVLNLQTMVLF